MVEKKFIKGLIKIDYIIYEKLKKTLVLNSLKMKIIKEVSQVQTPV